MSTTLKPPFRIVSDRGLARSPEFWEEYRRIEVTLENGWRISMFERK